MEFTIDWMRESDRNTVRAIYQEGIPTGNATFDTVVPTGDRWKQGHLKACRLVVLRTAASPAGWL